MEYNKLIADMSVGDSVEGFYILKTAYSKTTAAGKPFLSVVLSDKSGNIDALVWDYSGPIGSAEAGQAVKIRGEVSEFKGARQITAEKIRMADSSDSYVVSDLVPTAPINVEQTVSEVLKLADSIDDEDYRAVCREVMARHLEKFRTIPAAKSVHHSFLSGLLMHTANMLKTADFLSGVYSDVIDRSLLLAGTLLHDFAKEEEFTFSAFGTVTDYSVKGQLLGHLVIGALEISEISKELCIPEDKSTLLQHMILSHHGEPDFGAAVRPLCAEAELLSYIDMIDSRMEIYAEAFSDVPAGSFSGRIFALDKKIYNHRAGN